MGRKTPAPADLKRRRSANTSSTEGAMFKTKRVLWRHAKTGWHNYNWNAISANSVVYISASEGAVAPGMINPLDAMSHRRGAAGIFVKNINPHGANGGGVEFYLEVEWSSPLDVCLDITVFDKPEIGEIVG